MATPITVQAGAPVTNVDIIMKRRYHHELGERDIASKRSVLAATPITSFPFTSTIDTTGAGESSTDPTLNCLNGYASSNTVWYTLTAADDGVLTHIPLHEHATGGRTGNMPHFRDVEPGTAG
jgi:hypothetical protein